MALAPLSSAPLRIAVSLALKPPVTRNPPVILVEAGAPDPGEDWLREDDVVHLRWSRDATFASIAGSGSKPFNAGVIGAMSAPGWGWGTAPLTEGAWYFQIRVTRPSTENGTAGDTGWGGTLAFNDRVAPTFTSPAVQSLPENVPAAGQIVVSEPCRFQIVGGLDADLFDLNPDTGAWKLNLPAAENNGLPDFERKSSYRVTFQAIDMGGNATLQNFVLNITDVDDKPTLGDTMFLADVAGAVPGSKHIVSYTVGGLGPSVVVPVASTLPVRRNGELLGLVGTARNGDVLTITGEAPDSYSASLAAELRVGEGADIWRIRSQRNPSSKPGFSLDGSGTVEVVRGPFQMAMAQPIGMPHPRRIVVVWIARTHRSIASAVTIIPRDASGQPGKNSYIARRIGGAGPDNHAVEAWQAIVPEGTVADVKVEALYGFGAVLCAALWDFDLTPYDAFSVVSPNVATDPHVVPVNTPDDGRGMPGITLCAGYFTSLGQPVAISADTILGARAMGQRLQLVTWATRKPGRSSPGIILGSAIHSMFAISYGA